MALVGAGHWGLRRPEAQELPWGGRLREVSGHVWFNRLDFPPSFPPLKTEGALMSGSE